MSAADQSLPTRLAAAGIPEQLAHSCGGKWLRSSARPIPESIDGSFRRFTPSQGPCVPIGRLEPSQYQDYEICRTFLRSGGRGRAN
jgi:hypothetical protein